MKLELMRFGRLRRGEPREVEIRAEVGTWQSAGPGSGLICRGFSERMGSVSPDFFLRVQWGQRRLIRVAKGPGSERVRAALSLKPICRKAPWQCSFPKS